MLKVAVLLSFLVNEYRTGVDERGDIGMFFPGLRFHDMQTMFDSRKSFLVF